MNGHMFNVFLMFQEDLFSECFANRGFVFATFVVSSERSLLTTSKTVMFSIFQLLEEELNLAAKIICIVGNYII